MAATTITARRSRALSLCVLSGLILASAYGTSAAEALRLAAEVPDEVERLMLVGHEPTWSYLVHAVTGASVSMKTATVAGIDMHADNWERVPAAAGSLAYLLQPRLFADWELS